MIEDRQGEMRLAVVICLSQQITSPHPITPHRAGNSMLQFPSSLENPILVSPNRVCDIGLTHRHVSPRLPPAIEVMRNRPAPRLRQQGFQPDDVASYPLVWAGRRLGETVRSAQGYVTLAVVHADAAMTGVVGAPEDTVSIFGPATFALGRPPLSLFSL